MKTLKLLIATMLALAATVAASASPAIFKNGKSRYVIAVAAEASVSELTAAKELQHYIEEAGGVTLPIVNTCPSGHYISVGYNNLAQAAFGDPAPEADDETVFCLSLIHI